MFIDDTSIVNGTRVGNAGSGVVVDLSATIVFYGIAGVVGNCTRVGYGTIGADGARVSNCTARAVGNGAGVANITRVGGSTQVGDCAKILEIA